MRVAPEIQSWGEVPTSRESPYRDSCTFEALAKQKKKPLTTVAISTDQCTARTESVQGVRKCSEQTKGGVSQLEQNCDLSLNCSDNLERFWSLKLCILG